MKTKMVPRRNSIRMRKILTVRSISPSLSFNQCTSVHPSINSSFNHILTTHPHTAEDYYGADYPEDEVAEDDEYDRGAYEEYRKYASDNEEWGNGPDSDDEDGVVGSGDENGEFSTGQVFVRAIRRDNANKASAKIQINDDGGGEEMSE